MSDAIRGKPFTSGPPLPPAQTGEKAGVKEVPAKSNNPALNVKSYQQGQAPLPRPANQPGTERLLGDRTITVAQGDKADAIRAKRAAALRMARGDAKSVGAQPHQASAIETPAKTETKAAPNSAASKTDAGRPTTAGGAKSKADLTAFIRRQAFAATYEEHIPKAVTKAAQAAKRDPDLSAKLMSGSLTPRELEALAQIGMSEVRALVQPSANYDD